jgi:hypothetical protein
MTTPSPLYLQDLQPGHALGGKANVARIGQNRRDCRVARRNLTPGRSQIRA